jgi:hypothetical protein
MAVHGTALQALVRRADPPGMGSPTTRKTASRMRVRPLAAAIVCAWCRIPVQRAPQSAHGNEVVSHGLCRACARKLVRAERLRSGG